MRLSYVCFAAVIALAACGPARGTPMYHERTLEVRSPTYVRIYRGTAPRCPFREAGTVSGRTRRDLQEAAFRLRANAIILDPVRDSRGSYSGSAVQFTVVDCQQ